MIRHRNVRILSDDAYTSLITLLFNADDAQRAMMDAVGICDGAPALSSFAGSLDAAPSFEAIGHVSHPGVYILAPSAIVQAPGALRTALDDIYPPEQPPPHTTRNDSVFQLALATHRTALGDATAAHAQTLSRTTTAVVRAIRKAADGATARPSRPTSHPYPASTSSLWQTDDAASSAVTSRAASSAAPRAPVPRPPQPNAPSPPGAQGAAEAAPAMHGASTGGTTDPAAAAAILRLERRCRTLEALVTRSLSSHHSATNATTRATRTPHPPRDAHPTTSRSRASQQQQQQQQQQHPRASGERAPPLPKGRAPPPAATHSTSNPSGSLRDALRGVIAAHMVSTLHQTNNRRSAAPHTAVPAVGRHDPSVVARAIGAAGGPAVVSATAAAAAAAADVAAAADADDDATYCTSDGVSGDDDDDDDDASVWATSHGDDRRALSGAIRAIAAHHEVHAVDTSVDGSPGRLVAALLSVGGVGGCGGSARAASPSWITHDSPPRTAVTEPRSELPRRRLSPRSARLRAAELAAATAAAEAANAVDLAMLAPPSARAVAAAGAPQRQALGARALAVGIGVLRTSQHGGGYDDGGGLGGRARTATAEALYEASGGDVDGDPMQQAYYVGRGEGVVGWAGGDSPRRVLGLGNATGGVEHATRHHMATASTVSISHPRLPLGTIRDEQTGNMIGSHSVTEHAARQLGMDGRNLTSVSSGSPVSIPVSMMARAVGVASALLDPPALTPRGSGSGVTER